jgi:hypothetical protein
MKPEMQFAKFTAASLRGMYQGKALKYFLMFVPERMLGSKQYTTFPLPLFPALKDKTREKPLHAT